MCVGFIQPVLTSILHAWLRDRNIMSFLAGTPPVNTILTQALPGSPAMKIQVVSLKSGFDFEVKLSYDPTVSWKNGQQKWLQVVFWVFCFDFGGVQELFVCFSASIWSFFWFGLRHLFFLWCVCVRRTVLLFLLSSIGLYLRMFKDDVSLAILCELFWIGIPLNRFKGCWWPPTIGVESPGTCIFVRCRGSFRQENTQWPPGKKQ